MPDLNFDQYYFKFLILSCFDVACKHFQRLPILSGYKLNLIINNIPQFDKFDSRGRVPFYAQYEYIYFIRTALILIVQQSVIMSSVKTVDFQLCDVLEFKVIEKRTSISAAEHSFYLASWPETQPKLTFFPSILRVATHNQCHLVILFDNQGDWPNEGFAPSNVNLTLGDVSMDVFICAEEVDQICRQSNITWLIAGRGSQEGITVSEIIVNEAKENAEGICYFNEKLGHFMGIIRVSGWSNNGDAPSTKTWEGVRELYTS